MHIIFLVCYDFGSSKWYTDGVTLILEIKKILNKPLNIIIYYHFYP